MSELQRRTTSMVSMPLLIIMGPHRMPRTLRKPKLLTPGLPAEKLEKIGNQRWVASYFQGLEAWFNWRRTGYPKILPSVDNQNDDRIPVRFIFQGLNNRSTHQTEMPPLQDKVLTTLIPEFGGMSIQIKNIRQEGGEHSPVFKLIL